VLNWSPTLMEKRGLKVFESRVQRTVLGPKADDLTAD
jgi:hypothetical protein